MFPRLGFGDLVNTEAPSVAGTKINPLFSSKAAFCQLMPPPLPGFVTRPSDVRSACDVRIGRPAESRPFAQFSSTKGKPTRNSPQCHISDKSQKRFRTSALPAQSATSLPGIDPHAVSCPSCLLFGGPDST